MISRGKKVVKSNNIAISNIARHVFIVPLNFNFEIFFTFHENHFNQFEKPKFYPKPFPTRVDTKRPKQKRQVPKCRGKTPNHFFRSRVENRTFHVNSTRVISFSAQGHDSYFRPRKCPSFFAYKNCLQKLDERH